MPKVTYSVRCSWTLEAKVAKIVDADQTTPYGTVWSGSKLFFYHMEIMYYVSKSIQQMTSTDTIFKLFVIARKRYENFMHQILASFG